MTRPPKHPASRTATRALPEDLRDAASREAWTEAMSVRPFGDSYIVDCEDDGTHFVSIGQSNCTCGATADGERCKHVRRVAIEINLGRVPPPADRTIACQGCGEEMDVSAADDQPPLCADCGLAPGDLVVDREGDPNTPLLVVSEPGPPAEQVVVPEDDCTVDEYPDNERYPADAPVVEAVYPQAVSVDRPPRRYYFPVPRLEKPDGDDDRGISRTSLFDPRA